MTTTYSRRVSAALVSFFMAAHSAAAQGPDWNAVKSPVQPIVALPGEYGTPVHLSISTLGWEDSIYISRDGLNLYCIYVPIDLFSFTFFGPMDPTNFSPYSRGPDFGMDLVTNPVGASEWLHGDILYAQRNSTAEPFGPWELSNMARAVFSDGAPQFALAADGSLDLFVYTSNVAPPDFDTDLYILKNPSVNPTPVGTIMPAPVTTPFSEDNPHIERLDNDDLVLFFDSPDRPGGPGERDLWFATSSDDGASWTNPTLVTSLNTSASEEMPHLYREQGGDWQIYFAGTNPVDGKLSIFRAQQATPGDWDSWTGLELVIGAGNAFGIGEPTLTENGDISFVVLYDAAATGTLTDRFDADPWFLPRNQAVPPMPASSNRLFLVCGFLLALWGAFILTKRRWNGRPRVF